MLLKNDKGIYTFEKFPQETSLVHGFSTRAFGNMRPNYPTAVEARQKFAEILEIDPQKIVRMEQVHGTRFTWVTSADGDIDIAQTDSILSQESQTFLGVVTADCLPILLYDKSKKYVGVIHAGWKGVFYEIIKEAITEMIKQGSNPHDVLVGIGPCIQVCCYDITQERSRLFQEKFTRWSGFIIEKEGKIFLDLPLLAKYQLKDLGIPEENIDEGNICTVHNVAEFYSFRKEGEYAGRFMGLIGRI